MKVQTVGTIREFLYMEDIKKEVKRFNKKTKEHGLKATLVKLATGGTALSITSKLFTIQAFAQSPVELAKETAKQKIIEAFMPLVDMVQALSYPVALIMLTTGALMFMINQKDKGISLIQNASIGYILVQLMPVVMKLLVGIGSSVGFVLPFTLLI